LILAELLVDMEQQLRFLGLWETELPPVEALQSTEPFCIDTLNFMQWVQFIFLPQLYYLLENNLALPNVCQITPMAEEYFKSSVLDVMPLLKTLRQIDDVITCGAVRDEVRNELESNHE